MEAHLHTVPRDLDTRIEALAPEILGFLRRRVGREADELAQDVWLKVATAAPMCPDEDSFRAFVYVVARRTLIDRYRKRVLPLDASSEVYEGTVPADAESQVAAGDLAALVERTLSAMRPELVEVFWMRTRDDLAFKDIAAQQGCSLNTALGRMHQVVVRLRAVLAVEGWT